MLTSHIQVDLPSQDVLRSKGPIEWIRSLFGAQIDLRTGKEELTIGAFSLVEGLVQAFSRVRLGGKPVTDAISFLVDKRVVYLDSEDVDHDLKEISAQAHKTGVFNRAFREMHLVLTHKAAGLHLLFDIGVKSQVMVGEAELLITLSARLEELNIRVGESAADYAERVKKVAQGPAVEGGRLLLDQFTHEVAQQIRVSVPGSKIVSDSARIQVIRPSKDQVGRMRNLAFKEGVQPARYRPVPTRQRQGAYADPFFYYYHDPYYSLLNVILLHQVLTMGVFASPALHVVDPSGQTLFTGDTLDTAQASMGDWNPVESVDFSADGGMSIDPEVPMSEGPADPVDAGLDGDGSPMMSEDVGDGGYSDGGIDGGDGGDGGGSDLQSSCGSSCSSDSGSSCGSSCGGGCGGGD